MVKKMKPDLHVKICLLKDSPLGSVEACKKHEHKYHDILVFPNTAVLSFIEVPVVATM